MAILGNDSPSHASLPSSATIRHMLQHTVQLCTGAFARSPTAISTTIKPLTHLALASKTPFPPAASIWVPTAHAAGLSPILLAAQDSAVGVMQVSSVCLALLHVHLIPHCH